MVSEQTEPSRDVALRALLVDRVRVESRAVMPADRRRAQRRATLATVVVFAVVVALSIGALWFGSNRATPADGGVAPTTAEPDSRVAPSLPAGLVLGRWTSADGAKQRHTIHPDGLAIASVFECSGPGEYLVSIAHSSEIGGGAGPGSEGSCGPSSSSGDKGTQGSTTVTITTDARMTWTLTVVGVPETYVTPRPIPTPTGTSGAAIRYCTADDLDARFIPRAMPEGVTEVSGGDLAFTNRSGTTCALAGYPEVRFLDGGKPLGHHTMNHVDERSSTEKGLRAVVLRPGGLAYSQIDWYLANYYPENEEGTCDALPVTRVQVDLAYDLSSPGQTGTLDVPIGRVTACLNGAHGALGKYGQLSSTVFVDYPNTGKR